MSASHMPHGDTDAILTELDRIVAAMPRPQLRPAASPGLIGRMFGKPQAFGDAQRLQLEGSRDIDARAAVIVAFRLADADRAAIARKLPEALVNATLPDDGEERFMMLAQAARTVVRRHLDRTLLGTGEADLAPVKLRALVDAVEDGGNRTLAERLQDHFNAGWARRAQAVKDDIAAAAEDPLLVEIDNVVLGDVSAGGAMPYTMDLVVDGHPFATVTSPGDGSVTVEAWLGEHGPDDMEALRHYVERHGVPRSDEHGDRPDSLEEMLLDRVVSLFTRFTFQRQTADAVLFCVPDQNALHGQVMLVAPVEADEEREQVWEGVVAGYPGAILLDLLAPEDAFTLWLAYSDE